MNITIPVQDEHKIYKNSFLQVVGVAMVYRKFTKNNVGEEFEKDIKSFFNRFFNSVEYKNTFFETGISLTGGKDSEIELLFKPDYSYLEVHRADYKGFAQTIMPLLVLPKVMIFSVLKAKTLGNLAIRKINMFPFGGSNDKQILEAAEAVYNELLSNEYNSLEVTETITDEHYITPVLMREFTDGIFKYQCHTGIVSDSSMPGRYYLMLDTSIQYTKKTRIPEGTIDRRLLQENSRLYDLFHWCVNDVVLDLMNK